LHTVHNPVGTMGIGAPDSTSPRTAPDNARMPANRRAGVAPATAPHLLDLPRDLRYSSKWRQHSLTTKRCVNHGVGLSQTGGKCACCKRPAGDHSVSSPRRGLGACMVPIVGGLALGVLAGAIVVVGHMLITDFEVIARAQPTPTSTPLPRTATATASSTPTPEPTATQTPTDTPQPPTPTETPLPPTPTDTPSPMTVRLPSPTSTALPPTRTPRPTPTMVCPILTINVPSAAPAQGLFGIEWDSTMPLPSGWEYALEFRPETCVPSWKCVWTRLPVPLGWWEEGGHLHAQVGGPGEVGIWYWRVCLVNTADVRGPSNCCGELFAIHH
jgi:hypothetical protein